MPVESAAFEDPPERPSGLVAVATPTLTVLAGSTVALAGTLAVRAIMARTLDPSDFGLLITAIALVTATGGSANFGINPAAALRVGEGLGSGDEGAACRAARTALAFSLATGGLAAAVIWLGAPSIASSFTHGIDAETLAATLRVLAPVPLLMPIGGAALGVYRAHGRAAARALIRDGGGGIARAIGVAIGALASGTAQSLGTGYSAGVVLAEGGFVVEVMRRGWLHRHAGEQRFETELVRRLPPFGALEVLAQGRMWLDLLAISLLAPPAVVGIYGLARGLARGLEVVYQAGVHRYLPALGAAEPAARPALADDTRRVVLALLLVPVAIGLTAPAIPVLVLAGRPYQDAAPVLAWLSLAILVEALFGYQDQTLLVLGRSRLVAVIDLGALLTYGALLVWLIPGHGAIGAAWALVAGTLVRAVAFAAALSADRLAGWPTRWSVLAAASCVLLCAVAVRAAGLDLPAAAAIAVITGLVGIAALAKGRRAPS